MKLASTAGSIVRTLILALITFGACALLATPVSAAPGDPDGTFGDGGTVSTAVTPDGDARLHQAIATPDGGIVAAGAVKDGPAALVRYRADGSLDLDFGSDGIALTPDAAWRRLALDGEGRIVTFGRVGIDATVARFLPDGTPDASFGNAGLSQPSFRSLFQNLETAPLAFIGAGLDSQGRILAFVATGNCTTATMNDYDGCETVVIARLDQSGQPDPTFGTGGIVTALGNSPDLATVGDDDTITAAGGFYEDIDVDIPPTILISVARYGTDGHPMSGFDENGFVQLEADYGDPVSYVSTDAAGRATVASGGEIVRLTPAGKLDPGFGHKGRISLEDSRVFKTSKARVSFESVAAGPDGRFYLSGITHGQNTGSAPDDHRFVTRVATVRLTPSGQPDPTFANDGMSLIRTGEAQTQDQGELVRGNGATSTIAGPGGSVTVAGSTLIDGRERFSVVRFLGGTLPRQECDGRPATVQGTAGDDDLVAGQVTVTGDGDDRIRDASGMICSGSGDDVITGDGYSKIDSDTGKDTIDVKNDGGEVHAGPGDDEIVNEGGPIRIWGEGGDDRITSVGASSNDEFRGGPGKDYLDASWGEDLIDGGPGPDRLIGSRADDRLFGRAGNDFLNGGAGTDRLYGGPGKDVLRPGPRGPKQHRYRGKNAQGTIVFRVQGGKFVFGRFVVRIECSDGENYKDDQGRTFSYAEFKHGNRFGYLDDYTDDFEGDHYLDQLQGRLTARSVSGRFRSVSKYFHGGGCWSGRGPKNAWVEFRAKRIADPVQIVRQGS